MEGVRRMVNVLDVAKYILEQCGELTTMKLQKLCYYSQAWSLAWNEVPLFEEDFQAWANGPVCPNLFNFHRNKFSMNSTEFPEWYIANNLNDSQKETVDEVLKFYGSKTAHWLSELTHQELPWKDARIRAKAMPGEPSDEVITKQSMLDYYSGL
jgi:uncharacterized phage-associated protein